jgi:hypothetical protein
MSGVDTVESSHSDELVRRLLGSTGRMLLCMTAVVAITFGIWLEMGAGGFLYGPWIGMPRLFLPTVVTTVAYELATARIGRSRRLGPLMRHAVALAIATVAAGTFFLFNIGIFPPLFSTWHFFWSVYWPWVCIGMVGALLMPWVTLRRSVDGTQ